VPIFIYECGAISPFGHECDTRDGCDVCDEIALHTHWAVDRLAVHAVVVHDRVVHDRVVHDKSVINAGFHEIIHCRMGFLRSLF